MSHFIFIVKKYKKIVFPACLYSIDDNLPFLPGYIALSLLKFSSSKPISLKHSRSVKHLYLQLLKSIIPELGIRTYLVEMV